LPKDLTDYQKSTYFLNALKDSSVYSYQLHTWINRSKIRWQLYMDSIGIRADDAYFVGELHTL